jgi:GNAT superfamily N-acetyltransferase
MSAAKLKVVPITNAVFEVVEQEWLTRAEAVHRQLRPHLPAAYAQRMREVFAAGAEMAVAVDGEEVRGVTVFRMLNRTVSGLDLYCDDLVTDETKRSSGVGHTLISYMESLARERGCSALTLDSGSQRQQAHKFYFREGLTVTAFHFVKPLNK